MTAPFRIYRSVPLIEVRGITEAESQSQGPGRSATPSFDTYFGRLLKLIPTEVIGLYLVGKGAIPADAHWTLVIWAIITACSVVIVRFFGTMDAIAPRKVQWLTVVISLVSFMIWIYSMGDVFSYFGLYVPHIGSLLVLIWTFLVPFFYKGD